MSYIVTAQYEVSDQNFGDFISILKDYSRISLEEYHCHQFDVCATEDKTIMLYEVYSNAEAFQEHLRTEHYNEFNMRTKCMVDGKTMKLYQRIR